LLSNTTGYRNVASGGEALFSNTTGISNVAIGLDALHGNNEGFSNVAIGNSALSLNTTGAENTAIGVTALASNVTGTWNTAVGSRALYELKPVSFRLKKQFDPTQALGFGLIAEEAEKVNGDLVYRNDKGQVESVRYDMVNAMLLSEFLKEHQKVQEQEAMIAR